MNLRHLTFLSVATNLALIAGSLWLTRQPANRGPSQRPPVRPARFAVPVDPGPPEAAPVPVRVAPFHWREVASADFKTYRDNLRALGCPETTLRDILKSEINEYFATQRQAVVEQIQLRLWDDVARARPNTTGSRYEEMLRPFFDERERVLEEVLGPPAEHRDLDLARCRESWQSQYDWLPPDKRDQMVALEEDRLRQQWQLNDDLKDRTDPTAPAERTRRQAELNRAFETARESVLGPELTAESRLRQSSGAYWAQNLEGFQPNESEWRAVARIQNEQAEATRKLAVQLSRKELTQEEYRAATQAAATQGAEQLRSTLGPERFEDYERSRSAEFQQLARVVRRHGLDERVALEAFELQQVSSRHLEQVRQDASLPPERRAAAERAILDETRNAFREKLGPEVFQTYLRHGGDWMQDGQ